MGSMLKKSLIALLPISLGLGVLLGVSKSTKAEQVSGYSASSLPTTIDLNDTSAENIRSYYSTLNNLSQSERQGTNLLKNLKTILKNGQKYYSYDSGNAIWQIYEIADRDWAKSPASSTTYGTYNSSTNKITGYTYGTGKSSSKNNPYIHALYINRDVTNQTTAWDDHDQDEWGINREHVWPKAEGFETSGAGGARGDPMHLMAGNGYANNIHSNYYYGYVKTSSSYTNCGSKYSNQSGNLRGTSKTLNTGTVFEPQDCDKGDIARAIFYMVARYNYLSGSDSDGIDSNNPNLELTQSLSDWASSGYSSTTTKTGKMGILTDLLNWHHQDPVDEYEIHRNNLLFTNYTNNRNPFIDFPEWVDFIWGTATYNGTTYSSYSSTPTGYATPSSDTINGYNSGGSSDPVSVTGVTLEKETTSVEVGGSEILSYTISPTNATNQAVTWTSSNTSVATVSSSGRVAGVAEGSATITIKTSDGNFTDTCTVTVTAASGSSERTAEGSVTAASGALSGWTASGTGTAYADGSVKLDSNSDNVYKTDIFSAAVASGMTSLTVTINSKINGTPNASNSYRIDALDSSGNVLASGTRTGADVVTESYGDTVFTLDSNLTGCTGFKITYATKGAGNWGIKTVSWSATYEVSEEEITLSSIIIKTPPSKTTYAVGEDFVATGLVITGTYSDASTQDIPYEDNEDFFEFTPSENLQTSNTSVTISYGGKTTTQTISVSSSSGSIDETDSETIVFSDLYDDKDDVSSVNLSDSTITFAKGTNANNGPKYYNTGTAVRVYGGNTISFTSTTKIIIGIVFTFSSGEGSNEITSSTGTYDDGTWVGSESSVVFTIGGTSGHRRISSITVSYFVSTEFTKITNPSDLRTGDQVIFVSYYSGVNSAYYSATTIQSSTYLEDQTIDVSNNVANTGPSTAIFSIVKSDSYYSFQHENDGYIGTISNSTGCVYSSTIATNAQFSLSMSNSGVITTSPNNNWNYKYLRFNYNGGNCRFIFSSSSTYGYDVYIYKKTTQVTADIWCQSFLTGTESCNITNWTSYGTSYNGLSSDVKKEIYEAQANASTDYNLRSQAMARYDYIISDPRFDVSNFISERGVTQSKPNISILLGKPTDNVIIIVTYSLIGVSAIGGYFYMKSKRKEEF